MHSEPRIAYREAYLAALRRNHRPRLSWPGRPARRCRCGEPIPPSARACRRYTAAVASLEPWTTGHR